MAEKIGVKALQMSYNGDIGKLEAEHVDAVNFVENRYAKKRAEGYGESKGALNESGRHLKEGGRDLIEGGKVFIAGTVVAVVAAAAAVVGPIYYASKAIVYDGLYKGGHDALRSIGIAADTKYTTWKGAKDEKRSLDVDLLVNKTETTEQYAALAQQQIDQIDTDELAPLKVEEADLVARLKEVRKAEHDIIGGERYGLRALKEELGN